MDDQLEGKYATLVEPYKGYSRIQLMEPTDLRWKVEICGNGKELELYRDEFILDDE